MATAGSLIHEKHASPPARTRKLATLVIASRHDIVSAGIQALLQADGHRVAASCSEEDDLLSSVDARRPDITLLADNVARQNAATTVSRLRMHQRSMAIILLLEERHATATVGLLDLDVEGILLSGAPARSVIDCVRCVSDGGKWVDPDLVRHLVVVDPAPLIAPTLTLREGDVACLVSHGLSNKEIARELNLTEGTVKMHLHHIYEKMNLSCRTQLALSVTGACAPTPMSSNEEHNPAGSGFNSPAAAPPANGHS